MNDLYFACMDCRVMVDAGYRWALTLAGSPGFRDPHGAVCVDNVLAVADYWNPPTEPATQWLRDEVLPSVRTFLTSHRTHRIDFGDFDLLVGREDFLDWLQIGYWPEPTPRYFLEVLNYRSWDQVADWLSRLDDRAYKRPNWLDNPEQVLEVRKRFESLVRSGDTR